MCGLGTELDQDCDGATEQLMTEQTGSSAAVHRLTDMTERTGSMEEHMTTGRIDSEGSRAEHMTTGRIDREGSRAEHRKAGRIYSVY